MSTPKGGRNRTLNNVTEVKAIVDEFLKNPTPTLAGLARSLKIHPDTLYRNIDREDEIGDLLLDAYLHIVQKHEERLFGTTSVGSIFYLKCLKKHMRFKENDADEQKDNSIKFSYEIVDKREAKPPTSPVPAV